MATTVGCLLALILGVYRWSQLPAQAVIETGKQTPAADTTAARDTEAAKPPAELWQTKHFTSRLPVGMRLIHLNEASTVAPVIASYNLASQIKTQSDQVSVSIGRPEGSVNELAAVKLRASQPVTYEPYRPEGLPASARAFKRADMTEFSVFWQAEGRYAAVVASGSAVRRLEVERALQTIIAEWQWR